MGFSIGAYLKFGFGIVIGLSIISTGVNYGLLNNMKKSQSQVVQVRYPIVNAGKDLISGIHHSLSALRGYMILGSDPTAAKKFIDERQDAWRQIKQSVKFLQSLSTNMDNQSVTNINNIQATLKFLAQKQAEIEQVAQTPKNQPALDLLLNNAGPKATQMLQELAAMIEIEGDLAADEERKILLKYLANSHGAFATSVGGLRAYLITGESMFKDQFDVNWQLNTDAYLEIDESIDMLTQEQLMHWQKYEMLREQFAPVSIEMFRLRISEKWNIANYLLENTVEPEVRKIFELLERMSKAQGQAVDDDIDSLDSTLSKVFYTMFGIAIIVVLTGLVAAWRIIRRITRSMDLLIVYADEIARGDLAADHLDDSAMSIEDELGQLARNFAQMSQSLSNMVSGVKGHGIQMRMASFQVASLSEEILSASQQEASRSGEVTDATDKLLAASQTNLSLANDALMVVQKSEEQARIGIETVDQTIIEMECSVNEVNQTTTEIQALDEASQRIYNITDTIHQIADQTNLLALNAAIEAARAGEHGRGFAVVADEVRNLAIKTSQATVEISNVIKVLKEKVEHSILAMNRAAEHVFLSQKKAAETAQAINNINDSVSLISNSTVQISEGADAQMIQLSLLQEKLGQLFETLREDGSRAGAVSIIARVLHSVTENVNKSLDQFSTLPVVSETVENDRRSDKRLVGCLRVELCQGNSMYEGVTRNIGKRSLGVELSTNLDIQQPVSLTIYLPHNDFVTYKNQKPLKLKGELVRDNISEQVFQYGVQIDDSDELGLNELREAFRFFEDYGNVVNS